TGNEVLAPVDNERRSVSRNGSSREKLETGKELFLLHCIKIGKPISVTIRLRRRGECAFADESDFGHCAPSTRAREGPRQMPGRRGSGNLSGFSKRRRHRPKAEVPDGTK